MSWPVDAEKLGRVRAQMRERDVDALVCRAPDNVVYLTSYWPMKGYAHAIFPAEGDATLVVIAPQEADAHRTGWVDDVRTFPFYDVDDPRPPAQRALGIALEVLAERGLTGRIGIELEQGSQGADRMVGEPTVYGRSYFEAFEELAGEIFDAGQIVPEFDI